MEAAEGVGLAANQVGVDLAVFVFDCPDDDHQRHVGVICNPVVTLPEGKDRNLDKADEGCLSLPGAYGELAPARPRRLPRRGRVRRRRSRWSAPVLLARCLQHETDHLNGTVFGDRLAGRARKKLYSAHEELADLYPADWPVAPAANDDEASVAGDRGGGRDVERVDAGLHRDDGPDVGAGGPVRRQSGALGAEQDGDLGLAPGREPAVRPSRRDRRRPRPGSAPPW